MIALTEYRTTWPAEFELIANALGQILGSLALRIDHIGSTSVPGLAAKDIIDIQVSVETLSDEIVHRLVQAGYQLKPHRSDHVPPGDDPASELWSKLLFNEKQGERRANIHIRVAGNPNQHYPILFRDYLRAHPKAARTIELIKRQLVRYHGDDVVAYYNIKDPVYDLVWYAAQEWAQQTGWSHETS